MRESGVVATRFGQKEDTESLANKPNGAAVGRQHEISVTIPTGFAVL
jgi:hypothetical protein